MPEVGDSLGRYTLLRNLAAGGMGEIFLAARAGPLGFGPPVALKVLREELSTDQSFVDMLVDEANISRFLNHQNVVSVLDFGEEDGTYYIAMEFVQGVTLQELMADLSRADRRIEVPIALYIASELCRALKYAHTRCNHAGEPLNIVHRDVTPGNVLLSIQGEVKLTDFGIARAKGRVHHTQAGVLKGKFGYMAPEMLRYETIDARADLFCAGVVVYEMVAGRHPVQGASIIDAIELFEDQGIDLASTHNPEVPPALDAILMRAMEPKPEERWSSAAALGAALQELALQMKDPRALGAGASTLAQLIRGVAPGAFDNPIPKDVAEQLLDEARKREAMATSELERRVFGRAGSAAPAPRAPSNGSGLSTGGSLADSDPPTTTPFTIRPTVDGSRSTTDPAAEGELPTADALPAITDEHEPEDEEQGYDTLVPGAVAVSDLATIDGMQAVRIEEDYDHRPTDAAGAITSGLNLDAPTPFVAGPAPDSLPPLPGGRAEPPDAEGADATIPVGAMDLAELEAFMEQANAGDETAALEVPYVPQTSPAEEDDDGKTVATGMAVPEFDDLADDLADRPTPAMGTDGARPPIDRLFEEGELPRLPGSEGDGGYGSDDATAFSAAPPDAPAPRPSDDLSEPTIIPDVAPPGATDHTLLDDSDFDQAAREQARQELARLGGLPDDSPPGGEPGGEEVTRIRQDSFSDYRLPDTQEREASSPPGSEVSPRARQLTGPLRIKVRQDGTLGIAGDSTPDLNAAAQTPPTPPSAMRSGPPPELRSPDIVVTPAPVKAASPLRPADEAPPAPVPPVPQMPFAPGGPAHVPPPMHGQVQGPAGPLPQGPPALYPPVGPPKPARQIPMGLLIVAVLVAIALAGLVGVLASDVLWATVNLTSKPSGATVVLDDKVLGVKTPVSVRVKPYVGHAIEFRLEGHPSISLEPIEVGYREVVTRSVEFERLAHTVHIAPLSGRVFINDRQVGTGTKVVLPNLEVKGPVTIRVEATGHQTWTRTFEAVDAIPPSIDVPLQKKK